MGERNITFGPGELFIQYNGERVPVNFISFAAEPVPVKESNPIVAVWGNSSEAEFTGKINHRRMSRKRYIKKLMSHGVPRNDARECAKIIREGGISYFYGYLLYIL